MPQRWGFATEAEMRAALGMGPDDFLQAQQDYRDRPQRGEQIQYNPETNQVERISSGAPSGGRTEAEIEAELRREREEELRLRAELEFAWLPSELFNIFRSAWVRTGGSAQAALSEMRQSPAYEQFFPGNLREDGTVRLQEQQYTSNIEAFAQAFTQYGVPPDLVEGRFRELIAGNVAPQMLQDRLAFIYSNVASQANNIQEFYSRVAGISVSHSAIMTSVIRPDLTIPQLENKVRQAHIGGAAMEYDFDISVMEAERLRQFGLDRAAAQRLYSTAAQQLPTLRTLVRRHDDPDDDFTLDQLTDALVMEDAGTLRHIQRLFRTEQSQFAIQGQFVTDQQTGGLTGLRQR